MMKFGICITAFLCCFIFWKPVCAQIISAPDVIDSTESPVTQNFLIVEEIKIEGAKKTKPYLITREIPFKKGDTIFLNQLSDELHRARIQVYNLNLFSEVFIEPFQIVGNRVHIRVNLLEKWFIYLTPQFQLVDRNFTEWVNDHDASLDRVNYGLKFVHYNLGGRKDQLRIQVTNGYSRNIAFSYVAPYSNPDLTEGFSISSFYAQDKEIAYKTDANNKVLQFNQGSFVQNSFNLTASWLRRKGFFDKTVFTAAYTHLNIHDSIITEPYNPNFFNRDKVNFGYLDLMYSYQYLKTNNNNYPLEGKDFNLNLMKRGFEWKGGLNMLQLNANITRYFTLPHQWYSSVYLGGLLKLPFEQPYYNQRALGYNEFNLRGLEHYVVDGVAAVLTKWTLKKEILDIEIGMPIRIKSIPKIPIKLYAKTFADAGYSYNRKEFYTRLNNTLLYTGGLGLDILTFYDLKISLDYCFNQLNEKGLFLSFKLGF